MSRDQSCDLFSVVDGIGSQPLSDRRRELFARALFEGMDARPAYELAGFKRARGNATRMEKEPDVQARLNYLRRELDEADLHRRALRRHQLRQGFDRRQRGRHFLMHLDREAIQPIRSIQRQPSHAVGGREEYGF